MDAAAVTDFVDSRWDESIVPTLEDYIRIPNKSPHFDPDWAANGYMDQAVRMFHDWVVDHPIEGMQLEVVRIGDRTPVLLVDIPGTAPDVAETVLLYGHLDKQPEFAGWREDLGPWQPVIEDGRLYGRGGADDGYALFGSLTAIEALDRQGIPRARCVVLIEACEESGSYDLPAYIEHLRDRFGDVGLVVCLDAECGNYDQLWITTSLRGMVSGTLRVDVLEEGVHSGAASGIVPSSFRILRGLLERIEPAATGRLFDELHVDIPDAVVAQAQGVAQVLGGDVYERFPRVSGLEPMGTDLPQLVLNNTWRPTLSVTGVDGMPALTDAGNTLRPSTAVKLSFRLPPILDAESAADAIRARLEADPPYGAKVSFEVESAETGWHAPPLDAWLEESVDRASRATFGREVRYMGTGGTIPFMKMLGDLFPSTQFVVTGVLGPHSNAHGPNEFLHIATGKRVTACVSHVLRDHAARTAT